MNGPLHLNSDSDSINNDCSIAQTQYWYQQQYQQQQQQQQQQTETSSSSRRRHGLLLPFLVSLLLSTASSFPITTASPNPTSRLAASTAAAVPSWPLWTDESPISPATASASTQELQRRQIKTPQQLDLERRKTEWAHRYTNVQGLRDTFGTNDNKFWGDLDATTTRKLYKLLLPTVLMELCDSSTTDPTDLAPLAYQARKAAKLYARERSQVPYRIMANMMDGVRTFQKYGTFQPCGLSYQQIWDKYADEIDDMAQICYRILEKSCTTNAGVDRWLLQNEKHLDLEFITTQLEEDVRKLLRNGKEETATSTPPATISKPRQRALTLRKYRICRIILQTKRRAQHAFYANKATHNSNTTTKTTP